ncbi:MAG: metallophosphoesterase [Pseudomonadales bacterium]
MSSDASIARTSPWRRIYRRVAPPAVFTLIYYGVLVYPVLRILTLSFPDWQPGTPELLAIMVAPAAGRLACEWLPSLPARVLSAVVLTWLGVCFIGFCVVAPWELLTLFVPLPERASGLALMAVTLCLATLAFCNAHRLRLERVAVAAPEALRGVKLAQISDVHVGSRSGRFLRRVVRATNAAQPDYVLITGDLVDFADIPIEVLAPLQTLHAPAYFIIGNHERYVDCDAICQRLRHLGVHVLRNASIRVGGMQLTGIDDAEPKNQVRRVLERLQPADGAFRILLYHRPDGAEDAAAWGAHLMLTGHTHNGQIVPFNYIVRRVFPRIRGMYRVGDLQLYVSPGTGTWGPILRLGSSCEITLLTLQ